MMKRLMILIICLAALSLASCGAIPTLPPLDSTVTIWTPQVTIDPGLETATSQVIISTVTATPSALSTEAPTATGAPVNTATPTLAPQTSTPAATAGPTQTPTAIVTDTPVPTSTPTSVPFKLQMMNPYYLKNFTHQDQGCDWLGVAGQIFNADGKVQKDVVIRAGGEVNGSPVVEDTTLPLAEPDIDRAYGPGGFEVTLAASLVESDDAFWIQLFSLDGDPLSDQIYLTTYNDCQKNLILVNFVEE